MAQRFFSSVAIETTLSSNITNSATSATVGSVTGWPSSTPYTIVFDPGLAAEEVAEVTGVAGTVLTIIRGVDGSTGKSHNAGAIVRHMATARDLQEPNDHIQDNADVHGLTGGAVVVGTTQTQVLNAKTFQPASAAATPIIVKGAASQTGDLLKVQDSAATDLARFDSAGSLRTTVGIFPSQATVQPASASLVPLVARGAASQTADLFQAQNSALTVLAKIDASGNLTAVAGTFSGIVTATTGPATFNTGAAGNKGLIAKGAASQTANIFEVQSSAAAVLAAFNSAGRLSTPGVDGSSTSTFTAGAAGTVPLIAKGAASQTAALLEVQNSASTVLASFNSAGRVVTPGVDGSSTSTFTAGTSGTVPLIAKGAASQTADLFSARDSASAVVAKVTSDGSAQFTGSMAPTQASSETNQTTTSTSFQAGATLCDLTFVAPPSGKVYVTVSGEIENSVAATLTSLAVEVYLGTSSAGTLFKAADDADALRTQGTDNVKASRRTLVTGLTAGSTYYAQTRLRSSNSGDTASAFSRYLIVEPTFA